MKKSLVTDSARKRIKHLQFSVLSPKDIVALSEFEATQDALYQERQPVENGVLDRRLGTSDKGAKCGTCGLALADCTGHYAYVKLVLPVFHVGYFRHVLGVLQCICKNCSRVLLSPEEHRRFLGLFRRPSLDALALTRLMKQVSVACRKCAICPHCSGINGVVKKIGALRIGHDKYRGRNRSRPGPDSHDVWRAGFNAAVADAKELAPHLERAVLELNPLRVLALFRAIPAADCELLGLSHARPEDFLWQYVSVPPVCIRPSVQQDSATNEDDLTVKLSEIVGMNALIRTSLVAGVTAQALMEQWELLQIYVAAYINSETPGLANAADRKPIRGLCQRLKGKQGRFRGNLSGKRVDFSARTVISPDPTLAIDQVAVPERVAKVLTFPERVTAHNVEELRAAVRNGPEVHPGANFIVEPGATEIKKFLRFGNRERMAERLQPGHIVERHLRDNDVVLFNRQPSLHKLSIMSHRAKIRPWRTFRFNECVCTPYNADFDGDEMNLHVPQTEEARAEAALLMVTTENLVTPRNGEPIIAATQDFITGCFLLTRRDTFFSRAQFTQLAASMSDAGEHVALPPPAIVRPVHLWTGKQLFGVLMRPSPDSPIRINLECRNRTCEKPAPGHPLDMSPNDGYLVVHDSEIMCGVMDKASVGDGNKRSLFAVMQRDYGAAAAAAAMGKMAKLTARYMMNQGFSIGLSDVTPGARLAAQKETLVATAYAEAETNIRRAAEGRLESQPGASVDETLESVISGTLSRVRDQLGEVCMTELSRNNAPLIMATCGSKGSKINVSQMVACVGQQIISGHRVPDGFAGRSLPHFAKGAKDPPAKGFVRNSFYSGLIATEFLFHAISGREGLVDTAVKTAETGYMARRLMKSLEDLTARYDGSVRNASGGIVQFTYGDDGLDPAQLEGDDGRPVNYTRTWAHAMRLGGVPGGLWGNVSPRSEGQGAAKADEADSIKGKGAPVVAIPSPTTSPSLLPYEVRETARALLAEPPSATTGFVALSSGFISDTLDFIEEHVVRRIADVRRAYGLVPHLHPDEKPDREGPDAATRRVVDNKSKVTRPQLAAFVALCRTKYRRAIVEPGSTVGAVGAHSIGEPGTQMTLKTFHFAGVASMNVTLGVPRIKEIINAAKTISTPIITASLTQDDERSARIVKARIEKTFLGDIAASIATVCSADQAYVAVDVDLDAVQRLQLEVTLDSLRASIVNAPRLKIKDAAVVVKHAAGQIHVHALREDGPPYKRLMWLKSVLPTVVVKGIAGLQRAVIQENVQKHRKELLVEGEGLRDVMVTDGVVGTETTSNHIMEVEKTLGIEAARKCIINEIDYTMTSHSLGVDPRHLMLLGDVMCYKGEVLGITRFGVAKMKDSVLMLASFEKTTDHLFNAAFHSRKDPIQGVSECIIMGNPANNVGTAMPSLVMPRPSLPPLTQLLFESPTTALVAAS